MEVATALKEQFEGETVESAEEMDSAESVSMEEIEAAFEKFEFSDQSQHLLDLSLEGNKIEATDYYALRELEAVAKGVTPQIYEENIPLYRNASGIMRNRSVEELMSKGGL